MSKSAPHLRFAGFCANIVAQAKGDPAVPVMWYRRFEPTLPTSGPRLCLEGNHMPIRLMGGVSYPDSGFPRGRHPPALAGSKPETHTTQRGPQGVLLVATGIAQVAVVRGCSTVSYQTVALTERVGRVMAAESLGRVKPGAGPRRKSFLSRQPNGAGFPHPVDLAGCVDR